MIKEIGQEKEGIRLEIVKDTVFHHNSASHIKKVMFAFSNTILVRRLRACGLVKNVMRDIEIAKSSLDKF